MKRANPQKTFWEKSVKLYTECPECTCFVNIINSINVEDHLRELTDFEITCPECLQHFLLDVSEYDEEED